jgi:REase_MTES_1575/AAA domain/Protein of unknown function (DUF4011)
MTSRLTPEQIQQKIQQWEKSLAELTKRNHLLYFHKDKAPTTEILISATEVFAKLVNESEAIPDTELGIDDEIEAEITTKENLNKLRKSANSIFKEKGVNSLCVAIGTLTWYSTKDKLKEPIISPILLIPIEIEKPPRKNEYKLISTDEKIFFNPSLVLKLNQDYGITINDTIEYENQVLNYEELLDVFRNNEDINKYFNKDKWQVDETAHIGLFQRVKASTIQDFKYLKENINAFTQNPILLGLAKDRNEYVSSVPEVIEAKNLDQNANYQSLFQVLDADSSQQRVIEAAKQEMSFIVQGPPGTGKSQTIVNIITELIGLKKRVLVIAEKPVALEVIYDRLKRCNLEDICLNFSDKNIGEKKHFAKSINETKALIDQREEEQVSDNFFDELLECRQILNKHPDDLHQKWQPLNKSAFEIYGELLKFEREGVPTLKFTLRNISQWSYTKLIYIKNLLQKLSQFYCFFKGEKTTIWEKSKLTSLGSEKREQIYEGIDRLYQQIQLAVFSGNMLANLLNIDTPNTLTEFEFIISASRHIVDVPIDKPRFIQNAELDNFIANAVQLNDTPKVPKNWLKANNINLLWQLLNELEGDYSREQELAKYLNNNYHSEFLNQNLIPILLRCRKWGLFRCFRKSYLQDIKSIFNHRKVKGSISDKKIKQDLENIVELQNIRNKIFSHKYQPSTVFEKFFIRNQPDLFGIKQALIWLEELEAYHLPKDNLAELIYSDNGRREIIEILDNLNWQQTKESIQDGFDGLRQYFTYPEGIINTNNSFLPNIPLDKIQSFLETAVTELDVFREWLDYKDNLSQFQGYDLDLFLEKLKNSNIDSDYWPLVFEKSFYYYWLQYIYDNSPDLRNFYSKIHENKIELFSELDEKQCELAKIKLRHLHVQEWQKWSAEISSQDLITELEDEAPRKKKRYEIRQFITKIQELMLVVKPCWLMNPLMVSEYIETQNNIFDVVIFDEASQIRTEDGISSIMRSKQVIVVGDKQQMPPSSFFSSVIADEDDEDDAEDSYESLLAECGKFMKSFTLKWHYRSQDESLIDFSNRKFYESQLITFPNPIKDGSRGVEFRYIENGLYEPGNKKRYNIIEAEAVAQIILEYVENRSELKLGIIAFSKQQAGQIEKEIDKLSQNNQKLAEFCQDNSENFFVKNLENVQGDESDVIILSFGYGRDKDGKFNQNFGPLNNSGGDRRLNVAITRAKHKMILVASITPDLLESNTDGVRCFKEYFEYVKSVEQFKKEINQKIEVDCHFNSLLIKDIYYALQEQGYQIETSIGCSGYPIDLAVVKQQQAKEFLLGIDVDGLTYNKYPTARDRDRLRRKVLEENLKWHIHRIWSKEWYHNREAEMQRLLKQLKLLELNK